MVLLKSIKKQLNQFVTPEFETLVEDTAALVQQRKAANSKSELPAKNAYSHGLEDIYALENVDPSTIRTLGGEEETGKLSSKKQEPKKQYTMTLDQQAELNLGPEFVSTMPSFALSLPLDVLNISETALKAASQRGIRYIKDILECEWEEVVLNKGLGQGHAEEIWNAFEHEMEGKELIRCQTVDFKALLRSLLSKDLLLKHYVNFQQYGLETVIDLSPLMRLELKRAPQEAKARWLEESCSALKTTDCKELVRSSLEMVFKTFVNPWLWERKGFAYSYEIMDRLEQISEDPCLFDKSLKFFSSIYCGVESIFEWIMPTNDGAIIFVDQMTKSRFLYTEEKALSYFYKPNLTYSLKELVIWVFRELAASWSDIDAETVEKVITHSAVFKVRKSHSELIVYLA